MRKLLVFTLLSFVALGSFPKEKRDILQKEAEKIGIAESLVKNFSELNFPNYSTRDFWNNLPEPVKSEYIGSAEAVLDYDWPVVKATDYLEYIRSGDRRQSVYSAPRSVLVKLVMGELVEGKGRFIDQIVNGVWYYSEQTWWGWSAHLPAPKGLPDIKNPSIDLGVGEIANILSWTWFLFHDEFDKIHPLIASRLKDEIMNKAVLPYYERDDFWWMGFADRDVNNWNPWTNHNMLTAILIMDDNQERKIAGVEKLIESLDQFINIYPDDGGCDEGPSYWGRAGASLYQCLDLLKRATNNKFDVYDNQLIKNMGNYIYKAYINYPYFINFADADATTGGRPQIIYSYGKDINDPVMQEFGAFLAKKQDWGTKPPGGKIDEQIMQLMHLGEIKNATAKSALISDFWLPQLEVAGARDKGGSTEGFFFAAKGGNNNESHNHNDLGTCVLYFNGKPCLIDIGRERYTAKTFSDRRYEIWTMQSQYHNVPTINGVQQSPGANFKAKNATFSANDKRAAFSVDISGAYENAGVKKWERSYLLERGKTFKIQDKYELTKVGGKPTTLNLVTNCKVSETTAGMLRLDGDGFSMNLKYNPKKVSPTIEFNEVTDSGLKRYWPDGVTRIVFEVLNSKLKGNNELVLSERK